MDFQGKNTVIGENIENGISDIYLGDASDKESSPSSESPNGDELTENTLNSILNGSMKAKDFDTPSHNLSNKIRTVVEYLFSDSHIIKDKFLLKHIRRNKEGYVSLKLISSLRKVKALTKNWRVVAYSVEKSEKLQMNEEKTKIRRLDPLPQLEDDVPSQKKVFVLRLPQDVRTPDEVKYLLRNFGKISCATIIESDSDLTKIPCERIPSFNKSAQIFPYALVEFETLEAAQHAIHHAPGLEQNYIIVPFVSETGEDKKLSLPLPSPCSNQVKNLKVDADRKDLKNDCFKPNYETDIVPSPQSRDEYSCCAEGRSRHSKRRQDVSNNFETISNSDKALSLSSCQSVGDGVLSKWTHRRLTPKKVSVIILRQPRGPDGTIGFHEGRSKANLISPKAAF